MRLGKPKLFVLRPDFEIATQYGAYHFEHILNWYVQTLDITLIDRYGLEVVAAIVQPIIDNERPEFISGIGHGNTTQYTGQNYDILIERNATGFKRMKGLCASFLSCKWGQAAPEFVENGMKGFHGYIQDFYFTGDTFPNNTAPPFFRAHLAYSKAICDGKSQREAFDICMQAWNDEIANMDSYDARYALADRDAMIFEGDGDLRPMAPNEPPECPAGWHWDEILKECVPDVPPPPPKIKCCIDDIEFPDCAAFTQHFLEQHTLPFLKEKRSWFCKLCDWLFGCPLKD